MDILDMAKQLGEAISKTEEMKEYNDSEALVNSDAKAIEMLKVIDNIRNDFIKGTQNNASEEELDALREEYAKKQHEFETYDVTARFIKAKSNFDALMQQVNSTIIYGMTGEMPCSHSNCSSCSGGCGK